MMKEYEQRNALLKDLGFDSYADYLASPLWRRIRKRVLKQAKGKCKSCGFDASEVHHASYGEDVLRGKTITPLYALCRTCHEIGEFATNGRKRSLKECNRVLGLNGRVIVPKKKGRGSKKKERKTCRKCRKRKAKDHKEERYKWLCAVCRRAVFRKT